MFQEVHTKLAVTMRKQPMMSELLDTHSKITLFKVKNMIAVQMQLFINICVCVYKVCFI